MYRDQVGHSPAATLDRPADDHLSLPCRGFEPDLWFSEIPAELDQAKRLCARCPIRFECLAGAVLRREPWGVWGGEIVVAGAVVPGTPRRGRPRKARPGPAGRAA
jgi:WhiB family redox-sensing transcriptional regulator